MSAKRVPPFLRCEWDIPTISAIQALQKGEATAAQQQQALHWIINEASATYGVSFQLEGDRETAFAEGRRFVGLQLVKLLHLSTNALLKAKGKQNA